MSEEELFPIKGYEGIYSITKEGKIFSHTVRHGFGNKFIKPVYYLGYQRVRLWKDSTGKTLKVHRLVAQTFIPNPENKPQVNHINAIKDDNRVDNLEWCTCKENISHAIKNNLYYKNRGTNHKDNKLSISDVLSIRDMFNNSGLSERKIAKLFNVGKSSVRLIKLGKTWSWL